MSKIKTTHLTEGDLALLEENAGLMFSIREIAIILCVYPDDLDTMISVVDSQEYNFFHKGRLSAESKIRNSIYELAQNGSSPAQTQFLELIEKAKLDDVL